MFTGGPATSGQRSQPSMWNAVMFAMVFGLPALYVLVTGTYPRWGKYGSVFRGEQPVEPDEHESDEISAKAERHRDRSWHM